MRQSVRVVIAFLLLCGIMPGHTGATSTPVATPVPAASESGLLRLLGALPDRPLGMDGGMVTYADLALQAAVAGVEPPAAGEDSEGAQAWVRAMQTMQIPQTTGQHWIRPEWREAFGFDLYQIEQAAEFAAPPFSITAVRGSYDLDEVRDALNRAGYQPIGTDAGEISAVRDDFQVDLADPNARMAMAHLNVVAIADDGTLLFGSSRTAVQQALAAANGQGPSFAGRPDIAPLINAAPADLASALIIDGTLLQATPDPSGALVGDESPADIANRFAQELEDARQMPAISVALLGQTAGLFTTGNGSAEPAASLVVLLHTPMQGAAERAAEVITQRLDTRSAPGRGGEVGRPWADLFPERSVSVAPGAPVVLIDLVPAEGVSPLILQNLVFQRTPGFLAWTV